MFNPAKGLYWLRKGKKQLVSLKSPEDLQTCKDEYKALRNLQEGLIKPVIQEIVEKGDLFQWEECR